MHGTETGISKHIENYENNHGCHSDGIRAVVPMARKKRKENEMKSHQRPSVCLKCICFYRCPLEQITDQCPIVQRERPAEHPFDQEFGVRKYHRQMLLALEDIPWDGMEGAYAGGGCDS